MASKKLIKYLGAAFGHKISQMVTNKETPKETLNVISDPHFYRQMPALRGMLLDECARNAPPKARADGTWTTLDTLRFHHAQP